MNINQNNSAAAFEFHVSSSRKFSVVSTYILNSKSDNSINLVYQSSLSLENMCIKLLCQNTYFSFDNVNSYHHLNTHSFDKIKVFKTQMHRMYRFVLCIVCTDLSFYRRVIFWFVNILRVSLFFHFDNMLCHYKVLIQNETLNRYLC